MSRARTLHYLARLFQTVVVLLLVTFGASALANLIPGSAAYFVLGAYASPEQVKAFNKTYEFDQPLLVRYWHWLTSALHGDLGQSVVAHVPVGHLIKQALPVTAELAVLALAGSLLLATVLALVSAANPGGRTDKVITAITSLFTSIPVFISAVIFVYLFAIRSHVFPPDGWVTLTSSLSGNLSHAALPIITLVAGTTPLLLRVFRGDLIAVLQEDYVIAARARGMPEWYILFRYAFRPASISLLTVGGLTFGYLFAGSIIVETFYADPGIGLLVSASETSKDIPVVQGVVIVVACAYVAINLIVDALYAVVDPRRRQS